MVKIYKSTVLDAPAERVWRDLRDFNGLANWHPLVAVSRIEKSHPADKVGCVRSLQLKDGGRVREKLLSLSDFEYTYLYAVLESPLELEDFVARLRLFPVTEGNRCFVEWWAELDCPPGRAPEVAETVGDGMLQSGLDALKKRYGQR